MWHVPGCGREPAPQAGVATRANANSVPAPAVKGGPYVFTTADIRSVEQTKGPEEWAEEQKLRLDGALWTFKPDGTFIYAPSMSREDLYPIQGTYKLFNNAYEFEAVRSVDVGGFGETRLEVYGAVEFSSGKPILEMSVSTQEGISKASVGTYKTRIELRPFVQAETPGGEKHDRS